MNRVALFAHHDSQGEIKRYVEFYLARLRQDCDRIVFVSTASLPDSELQKIKPLCSEQRLKDNVGYDFGMWKHALAMTDLSACDELLLVNSSCVGPLWSLSPIFRTMSESPCDFWSMTSNAELAWHLQSYFLVFKRRVLESAAFRRFWDTLYPYADKKQLIRSYEVGLTVYLQEQGFRPQAYVPVESLAKVNLFARLLPEANPTLRFPLELLRQGMPLVKLELLRDNPRCVALDRVIREIEKAGYDRCMIEFDRPPKSGRSAWRERVRECWKWTAA